MMRSMLLAAVLSATVPIAALAQTADDLKNDATTPGDVLVYGMGYSGNRYSPLTQITKENVSKLVPVWSYSLADLNGGEGFPIVKDGVIYITTHDVTAAVDALTGKQIWRVKHDYPPETLRVVCCGIVNRGAGIYEGMIIRALMDDRMIALDAKTGKTIWEVKSPDPVTHANGYAMTGAPLIVNGIVIVGVAGAEFSHRGLLEGYDAKTGKHLWRTYTIPAKGEPGSESWEGDSQLTGGGSSWVTGTYDPELDLVYWGIGNPAPWNARARKGDNLFTNSVFAVRPKTGERVWYYQTTPGESWDFTATQHMILADLEIQGRKRKVLMQAPKNGFFYVLDRTSGEFLSGKSFIKTNWYTGFDAKGRPIRPPESFPTTQGTLIYPGNQGGTNWYSPSFSPVTGLFYIPAWENSSATYRKGDLLVYREGQGFMGAGPGRGAANDDVFSSIIALDPRTGDRRWTFRLSAASTESGVLTTQSNMLFAGGRDGQFVALDARDGKLLWETNLGPSVSAGPVTYMVNGKQYVSIQCGAALYTFSLR